jgi:hypothetical protein
MQLLQSQTDSTPTQAGYLNGVYQTYFTSPWTQRQFEGVKTICEVRVPDNYVFLTDMGLHNAGWEVARVGLFDALELIGGRAKFCWAREPQSVEIVSPKVNPNHQGLLSKIYQDGPARATSERLIAILDDVFQLLSHKSYSEIDLLLSNIDLKIAAPEYFVGLLRATSKEVRHLPSWPSLLASIRIELRDRKLNAEKILIGLS